MYTAVREAACATSVSSGTTVIPRAGQSTLPWCVGVAVMPDSGQFQVKNTCGERIFGFFPSPTNYVKDTGKLGLRFLMNTLKNYYFFKLSKNCSRRRWHYISQLCHRVTQPHSEDNSQQFKYEISIMLTSPPPTTAYFYRFTGNSINFLSSLKQTLQTMDLRLKWFFSYTFCPFKGCTYTG